MGGKVFKSPVLNILLFLLFSYPVFSQTGYGSAVKHNNNNLKKSTAVAESKLRGILVDEEFDDWDIFPNLALTQPDTHSDKVIKVTNDSDFLYIYFEIDSVLAIQENNSLALFLDSDDNSQTGFPVNGIGAEIEFRFGEREGRLHFKNSLDTIGVGDLFLVISPTVWSDKFEITMDLSSSSGGKKLFSNSTIRILIKNTSSGFALPGEDGGAQYTIADHTLPPLKSYSMDKQSNEYIRVLSHNVLFSSFFREDRKESYRRMYQTIQPDIIGFSELYQDYKLEDVTNRLEEILPSPREKSWKARRTADNVLATRFSFRDNTSAGPFGNGAFLLDLRPKYNNDLLVIVAHPTCCDNDSSRQHEVDAMIELIRESKTSGKPFNLQDKTPVIIMGDMNFVGDPQQVKTLLEGDIFHEDIYGKDHTPDWDGTFFDDAKPLSSNLPHTFTHTGYGTPGTHSNGRLDYIIYSGSILDLENSFVMYTPAMPQELLNKYKIRKDDSQVASDHLPVIGDFRLTYEQDETVIYTLRKNDNKGLPIQLNSMVTVTGIVTASQEFGDDGYSFIQNDQAAVAVKSSGIAQKLEQGDLVTVTGAVSQSSGLTYLIPEPDTSQFVVHKKVDLPRPRIVTIADIKSQEWNGRELLEGRLIKIEDVQLLSSGKFKSDYIYKITDDKDTLEIRVNGTTDLVNRPIPAERISITGCLVQNKSAVPFDQGYQLHPRSVRDLEIIKPIEHLPILALRQNNHQGVPIYNDSAKTVSGIVTATNQFGRNGPVIIQDKDAGIALYGSAYVSKVDMGDSITITGPLVVYRGMTEYIYDAEISEIVIHKNVAAPEPQIVTISDILNQEWNGVESLESKLVIIQNVTFVEKGTFSSYRNYQITDGVIKIGLRLSRAGNLDGTQIPQGKVSVIGIVNQNKSSVPYKGGYQILPRSAEDIIIK